MSTRAAHQLTSNVKLLQKIVLSHEGRVLLLQRDEQSFSRPLCWDLPGGNSEWPETVTQPTSDLHQLDAAREILEETGIIIDPAQFSQKNLTYFETFFDPSKQIFTVLLGWKIELTLETPTVTLSEEHVAYKWLSPEQAQQQDFGGTAGSFVPKIIQASL